MSPCGRLPPDDALQQGTVLGFKRSLARIEKPPPGHNNHVEARRNLVAPKHLSYQSFSTVSLDGAAELPRRGNPQSTYPAACGQEEQRAVATVEADPLCVDLLKLGPAANPLVRPESQAYSLLTVRRFRPFARRRLRTRRPFLVLIRTRKPWARTRWRVLGWNVRFPFILMPLTETNCQY